MLPRLAEVVRRQRQVRGWSQLDLARTARLSQQTISTIESGANAAPTGRTLMNLAAAFGLSTAEFLDEVGGSEEVSVGDLSAFDVSTSGLLRLQTLWVVLAPKQRAMLLYLAEELARLQEGAGNIERQGASSP